jgi:hypothetical protein
MVCSPWPRILADVGSGRLQPKYLVSYENDYRCDSGAPAISSAAKELPYDDESDCDARLPQSMRVLLSGN